jgi:two-component system cell cycle sensor histidine kinase/response regulator CckA
MRMMRRLIPENIRVTQALEGMPCQIRGDKNSFAQVLMNLVLNARDALDDGEGEIAILGEVRDLEASLECTEGVLAPGRYAVLSVVDTGVGIRADKLQSIFEPFTTSKGERGTGLGLTVVRHAVLQHLSGAITVTSEEGKGTRFELFFPIASSEELVTSKVAARPPRLNAQLGGRTLALVEDNESVRASLERVLITSGHDVLSFSSGSKLLTWASENKDQHVDLLITDVVMPGLSGPKTYREFEALRPGVRVLFISGYRGTEFKDFKHTREEILQKPVSREDLLARIEALLS